MTKLERLLNLIAALLNTDRPLTAGQIRQRIEGYPDADASFRRAFERDKDELRRMDIPLRVEPVPGVDPPIDGYRILRSEYAADTPEFEPDELAALHLASNLVHLDGADAGEGLRKLGGVIGHGDTVPVAALPNDPNVISLFDASRHLNPVVFDYGGATRRVQPWRLSFRRGHWYLAGFDETRDDERMFRLDRITGDVEVVTTSTFERRGEPRAPDAPPWELGDAEPVDAHLLVDADQAVWATHYLGRDAIVDTRADGSIEFGVIVRDIEAFRSFVLTFLDHGELLGPPPLRADIIAWLEAFAS